jgi:hypothetical protein
MDGQLNRKPRVDVLVDICMAPGSRAIDRDRRVNFSPPLRSCILVLTSNMLKRLLLIFFGLLNCSILLMGSTLVG